MNGGHALTSRCHNCHRMVDKDKAIKRFTITPLLDPHSIRDIQDSQAYEDLPLPSIYLKATTVWGAQSTAA